MSKSAADILAITPASAAARQRYLKTLKTRAGHLVHGVDRAMELQSTFDTAIKLLGNSPEALEAQRMSLELQSQALADRLAGNPQSEANRELNAFRILTVDNFITTGANGLSFFEPQVLGEAEEPLIENKTMHEMHWRGIGQDGGVLKEQFAPVGAEIRPSLGIISTPEFEYVTRDLRKGNVRDTAFANINVAQDLTMKLNSIYWNLAKSSIGNFVTTGRKERRAFVPHSSIDTTNLPTTNLLAPPSGNTTTSKWRLDCIKEILYYESKWDGVMFPDGTPLRAVAVYIPSKDVMGMLDTISEESHHGPIADQLADDIYSVSLQGRTILMIGDATLSPAAGLAYVRFNKPVGYYFTKPSMSDVWIDNSLPLRKLNKETMSMTHCHGGCTLNQWMINIAAVRYRTAS